MGKYDTELSDAIAKMDAFWKDFEAQKAQREARRKAWTDLRASGLLYTSPEAWESAKAEAEEAAEREAHRHPVRPKKERTRYAVFLGRGTNNRVAFKPGMLDWLYGWLTRDGALYTRVWEVPEEWEKTKKEIEAAQDYEIPQTYEDFMHEPQSKPKGQICRKDGEKTWGSYEVSIKACPGVDMPSLLMSLGMDKFGPNYGQDGTDIIRMKGHRKDLFYQLADAGFRYWDQPQDVERVMGKVPPEYLQDFDDGMSGRLPDRFKELLG